MRRTRPRRQFGIDDSWDLPEATNLPRQGEPVVQNNLQGVKRKAAPRSDSPPEKKQDEMMDLQQDATTTDFSFASRVPVSVPAPDPVMSDPFHQDYTPFSRDQRDLSPAGRGLPPGLPPPLLAGFGHRQHGNNPHPFSPVVEPPRRPIGGDRLWLDDSNTIASLPSLAEVSMPSTATPVSQPTMPVSQQTRTHQPPTTSQGTRTHQTPTTQKAPASNPKSEIHAFYGKQQTSSKTISTSNYHTWHDGGPAHHLRWTSVFCCPNHGVLYHSIPFQGCPEGSPLWANDSFWFSKKTTAEHAAAAHAYDYQSGLNKLADVDPLPDPQWEVPVTAPSGLRAKIEAQQNEFRVANGQVPLVRRQPNYPSGMK